MNKQVGGPPRHDSHSRYSRAASCNLMFESLEPRQLLATTLYVDFGFGFNPDGFNINDADNASVGGPLVFQDDYHLTTVSQDLFQFFQGDPDFDNDDVQQFVDLVFSELFYLFEPFDVSVQYAQASSIDDIAATLQSTITNDAYIYVGGPIPDAVEVDFGSSVVDPGNLQDNLGFVFTADLNFDDIYRTRDQVATNIARQAAFTYGVLATEATEPAAYGNVTSLPGTDAEGNRLAAQPANTGSALDPFSGQYRVFDGATLPEDDTAAILTPLQTVQAYDQAVTRSISTITFNSDLDGITDQVFAARRDAGGSGEVRIFDGQIPGSLLNSVLNNHGLFDDGIERG